MYFKNATRNKVEWRVKYVETDHSKCKWSKGGKRPNFIQLERVTPDKRQVNMVWTCSDQLVNAGFKK